MGLTMVRGDIGLIDQWSHKPLVGQRYLSLSESWQEHPTVNMAENC